MKLKSTTLGLLAGAAAFSSAAFSAEAQKNAELGQKKKKPAAHGQPKLRVPAPITERELKSLFILCDANKDGNITFEEFKKAYPMVELNVIPRILAKNPKKQNRPNTIDPCPRCGLG